MDPESVVVRLKLRSENVALREENRHLREERRRFMLIVFGLRLSAVGGHLGDEPLDYGPISLLLGASTCRRESLESVSRNVLPFVMNLALNAEGRIRQLS